MKLLRYNEDIITKGLNKRSRLPRRQTLAVGSFPLARSQLTLGTSVSTNLSWLFLQETGLATQGKKNGRNNHKVYIITIIISVYYYNN